ncbi:hypothetical protein TPHV1_210002 [Treponema phagedenis]|uniref:Uncharacterized protein n=1 Tax=Treponema phagedenis TaxID=162 RepID=A0A0B7GT01_TREPH|nr:hypothetical protein TPHV1_210002 [Treponema phagedenis]
MYSLDAWIYIYAMVYQFLSNVKFLLNVSLICDNFTPISFQ